MQGAVDARGGADMTTLPETFVVVMRCGGGHEQRVVMEATREEAESFAGTLDGSHPMFIVRRASRCAACGEPFTAEVLGSSETGI
jgi:hypothetical protein